MSNFQLRLCSLFRRSLQSQGLTLLEVLVIVLIVSILAAIATPYWLQFLANRRVTAARDEIRQGILMAQNAAITHRSSWRFSIRSVDDHLEWTTHPDTVDWEEVAVWQSLHPAIVFDEADTTMASSGGTYYVKFGFKGEVRHRLSTVTLDSKNKIAQNQCVVISTLIGATRKGEEHVYPNGDRYCY